ncbi:putative Enterobactin exporter EntS [Streptomyces aurantiacus JA 4570]|uniref:Putative Enterobactin exporter EntS n=1 Tax=Streptomyces aurantiacus JA 4570 TaxID=1286094 RepID=S4AM45_9ACTN|nr:putative Enterobactin exporter EntS [Streptomyces aurantiacus JA 4570]
MTRASAEDTPDGQSGQAGRDEPLIPVGVADPAAPAGAPAEAGAPSTGGAHPTPERRILADLTPLRTSADYRRLWVGNTISWVGQAMTALAVSLQVYDITHSSFSVGLVGLFSLVPLVVFGLYGGAIADTVDRRKLGLYSSAGLCALSFALAGAAFIGYHHVWFLYGVVALQATCGALNSPARTSMIPRLLPPEQLPAANALNSITTTSGAMLGPMLGGLLVGLWGYQAAYAIDAVAFTAALYAMWRLPSMRPLADGPATGPGAGPGPDGKRQRASVIDGLRFLATRPNIRMTFFTDLCAMVLAHPRALFPAIAVVWYGGDAKTTGLLVAAPAVGALLGGVFSGWLGRVHRHGLAIALSVAGWGAAVAVFGLTRNLWLGLVFLALAGCADTISMVFRSTMLQAATPDAMRGRLQGVFIVVVAGGPRAGDFLAGTLGDLTSPRVAIVGGGAACVVAVGLLVTRWRAFLRYDARDPQA